MTVNGVLHFFSFLYAEPAEPTAMHLLTETLQAMQKNQLMIMEKLFETPQPSVQPGPSSIPTSIPITISLPACSPATVAVTQPPPASACTTQSSLLPSSEPGPSSEQNYTDVSDKDLNFLWELSSELEDPILQSVSSSVYTHSENLFSPSSDRTPTPASTHPPITII